MKVLMAFRQSVLQIAEATLLRKPRKYNTCNSFLSKSTKKANITRYIKFYFRFLFICFGILNFVAKLFAWSQNAQTACIVNTKSISSGGFI